MQFCYKMWMIVIGFFFTLCCLTRGFDNQFGHHHDNINESYRILLLGKTGHGKSSLGNHLLGREAFKSSPSPNSETKTGQKISGTLGDQIIIVVDTPGVSDTVVDQSETVSLIAEAVALSPKGYDGFLIVLNPNVRITREEKHAIKLLRELFGDRFFNYVIFVFTHKNGFEQRTSTDYSFYRYLNELDNEMKNFLKKARGRHVLLDTKEENKEQRKQTNMKFLEHLENIRLTNEGERYSNILFDTINTIRSDYDNGRHQRSRYNVEKHDERGIFRYMYDKAKALICTLLRWTPFSC